MTRRALIPVALLAAALLGACDAKPAQNASGDSAADTTGDLAPLPTTSVVTDSAVVDGVRLWVLEREGACALRHDGPTPGELPLVPTPPCRITHSGGTAQRFAYPDVGVRAALVVLGTVPADSVLARYSLLAGAICGAELQGILLRESRVEATRSVRRGGVTCRDDGVDEKEFHAFAHDG
jgi:hypothetical protein